MSGVKEWVVVICISVIACTMLEFITPDGKMERIVRFVFGAFMIIAIIGPLINMNLDTSFEIKNKKFVDINSSKLSENIYEQSLDVASKNIKRVIKDELKDMNLKYKKIDVIMDKRDKGCISISKVKIYTDNENLNKKEEVRKKLKEKLDLNIEIYWYLDVKKGGNVYGL